MADLDATIGEFKYRITSLKTKDGGITGTTPEDVLCLLEELKAIKTGNLYVKLPPVTPGITTVWIITDTGRVQECHVGCYIINGNGAMNPDAIQFTVLDTGYDDDEPVKRMYRVQDIGKNVWLSEQEALDALKEKNNAT